MSRFQTALAHLFMVGRNSNWRCRPVFLQKVGGVLFGVFIFLITNEGITIMKKDSTTFLIEALLNNSVLTQLEKEQVLDFVYTLLREPGNSDAIKGISDKLESFRNRLPRELICEINSYVPCIGKYS